MPAEPLNLVPIRALVAAVPVCPLVVTRTRSYKADIHMDDAGDMRFVASVNENWVAYADLFAEAHARIPALCDEVERLRAENQRLQTALSHAINAGFVAVTEALAERDAAFAHGVRRGLEVAARMATVAPDISREGNGIATHADTTVRPILAIAPASVKP